MCNSFSNRIKNRRIELGLTLEDVGKIVGVGKSTVRKWETGMIQNIRRNNISALAQVLQATPEYLLGWDEQGKTLSEKDDQILKLLDKIDDAEKDRVIQYISYLIFSRSCGNGSGKE